MAKTVAVGPVVNLLPLNKRIPALLRPSQVEEFEEAIVLTKPYAGFDYIIAALASGYIAPAVEIAKVVKRNKSHQYCPIGL